MPTPILTRVLDPAVLLEQAVDGLFPARGLADAPEWPTLSAWIVLRQGGLRDDLHRLAAARGVAGWFDAPVALFTELLDRWGPEAQRPTLSEPERHALLSRILDESGRALFPTGHADAWVPAVDRFIGELMAEGIAPADFARAAAETAVDGFAQQRAESLAAVYEGWQAWLARAERWDGRDARVRLARHIREQPEEFARRLGARREIRIVGLADLRGGWTPLLRALADDQSLERLEVLTSVPLQLPGAASIDESRERSVAQVAEQVELRLIEAPDPAREVERIAVEVRAFVDAGVAPHRVAVVAREARPAVDDVAAALELVGVPVTARRRTALAHTTPGRALLAILEVLREGWSRHALVELAEQPLLATGLDADIVNAVGFSRAMTDADSWREGLEDLEGRARARERGEDDGEFRRAPLPASELVASTREAFARVAALLEPLAAPRTLEQWCRWGADALTGTDWGIAQRLGVPLGRTELWYRELRAREQIRHLLEDWHDAGARFGNRSAPMDAARFVERLQLILAQDLITLPLTDDGVVVAEALAAGWRSFDHVFVVGLAAGQFPLRPADSAVLDREEREALRRAGLPLDPTDAWRARESELFHVLCAAPRQSLTLSWPALDAEGREVARSAFVDAFVETQVVDTMPREVVVVPGFPSVSSEEALAHAATVARIERERPPAYNGAIEDEAGRAWLAERYGEGYPWSATQLEGLAKCPWSWFAERVLRVEERRDADDLLEPSVAGSLRHEALELLFQRAIDERGAPVVIGAADREWVERGIEATLREAWEKAERNNVWLGPEPTRPVVFEEMLRQLRGYLAFEQELNDGAYEGRALNPKKIIRSGAMRTEFEFHDVLLESSGVRFKLRGLVDRIDQGEDRRIPDAARYLTAIDYKSSKGSTPGAGQTSAWADGIVLQVPLYAKALQQLFPDFVVSRMEYRSFGNKPERVHSLDLHPVKGGELQEAPEAEQRLEEAMEAAARTVTRARTGDLPTLPTETAGCSPYCVARDFCRIPGGPVKPKGAW